MLQERSAYFEMYNNISKMILIGVSHQVWFYTVPPATSYLRT